MASANMVSAASVNKVALGQGAAASGSTLGKSTFTGACLPVSYTRVSRRTEGKVCMSASKDEGKKVSAPLRKGLAAGLMAATIATSSGPAFATDILPNVEKRWGNITQKVEKAGKQAKEFTPNLDALNKKNALAEATAGKIPQRGAPSFGSKAKSEGLSRQNVSFTEAPPLVYVVDTKGTPADPETVKDDVIGGVTDPASIPGRIKERAGTIASKIGQLNPKPDNDQSLRGDRGVFDVAPRDSEGSSQKATERTGRKEDLNPASFSSAPALRFVVDTKGTPADPETVKDDAIGGVTDPASIPGRIKERAGTIASKIGQLTPDLPSFNKPDTKGTPADPETVKDDAIGGVTDPGSIPGRIKERAGTIASKLPNVNADNVIPGDKGVKDLAPDLVEGSSEKIPQKKGGYAAGTGVSMTQSAPLVYVLDTKGTPADPETVKDDAVGGVKDPASIPGRIKERASTIASKIGELTPDLPSFNKPDTKGTPADPETVKDDAIGGVTDPGSIPGRIKDRADTIASKLPNLNADKAVPGNKGVKDIAPDLVEGSSEKIQQKKGGYAAGSGVSMTQAPPLVFVGFDTKGTPADPETVKDDAIGGVTDPASIPGRINERAGTIASKLPNLPNIDQAIPGDKGVKDVAPDLVEGSSEKVKQRGRPSFGNYGGDGFNRSNVAFTDAPMLQYVGFDTKGTPADPETVKDDAIGGLTDPASIPGRIKERAGTIASKLPNAKDALPSKQKVKDVAPDLVEGSSQKIQQRPRASFGTYRGNEFNRANVSFSSAPTLTYVVDTKGTPADPETVKDDVVGGVTDPASIPGRIKERAGTIASKLPNLPNVGDVLPGSKGLEDVAPDLVEGSSEKIKQRSAPSYGNQGAETNRTNTAFSSAPALRYVVDTKGTPADPETVKDDVVGGVTDPASIPGRIKERANTIASKLPDLPNVGDALPGSKGLKDVAPDLVEGSSEKIQQRSAPSYGNQGAQTNRTNTAFSAAPALQFVGLDTKGTPADPATVKDDAIGGVTDPASIPGRIKERAGTIASKVGQLTPDLPSFNKPDTKGTPADPETVKDDAIGGVTDPASIPGRIKERAGTIASKLPDLPDVGQALPGNKGLEDVAPDLVEGSSEKIQQRSAPSFNSGADFNRTNVSSSSAPTLQYVGIDTKGTPADPATVKDDLVGGITDPASIPGRIKERADTIASKLPSPPKADDVIPGKKAAKDIAPDLVNGSDKIPQRTTAKN